MDFDKYFLLGYWVEFGLDIYYMRIVFILIFYGFTKIYFVYFMYY